ncbi:MAG: glycosyltransferase, partial [Chitinivibrionales bacterium]
MNAPSLDIVFIGLTITSSWGNGHATTYRGLTYELSSRGHSVLFLERDVPWYASNRDMPTLQGVNVRLYNSLEQLQDTYADAIRRADIVIVGSYVPDGIDVGDWVIKTADGVTAFYDIDTPVTLSCLASKKCTYLSAEQIPNYDLYLSFSGGPILDMIEQVYGSPNAQPLYCS